MQGHTHTHTHVNPLDKREHGHTHPEITRRLITHSHDHAHVKTWKGQETWIDHEKKAQVSK